MREPVIRLNPKRLGHSVAPTVIILIAGSMVAALVGAFIVIASFVFGITGMVLGPAILIVFPLIIAQSALLIGVAIVVTPIWALSVGSFFAGRMAGKSGLITKYMGVKLLPDDHKIIEHIQEMADHLSLPRIAHVGYYESDDINAFAAGMSKDSAMIAFSTGLLQKMTGEQFMAVMCHELAHVANGDMRKMTLARGVQDALTWFLYFNRLKLFVRWLFCFVSELEILRLSRTREYYADAIGATLMGSEAMIGALECIERDNVRPKGKKRWYSNFFFLGARSNLLSTHPPIQRRIKALETRDYIRRLPIVFRQDSDVQVSDEPIAQAVS